MTPLTSRRAASFRARNAFGLAAVAGLGLLIAACDARDPSAAVAPDGASASLAATTADQIVLVGFASQPGAAEIALLESFGARIRHQFRHIPVISATLAAEQVSALRAAPGVAYVDVNRTAVPLGTRQITDYGIDKVEAPAAWALGYSGQLVKVGIFDSGIDVDHPDLRVVGGVDLINDGNGLDDCQGHGTHVAGIVGAKKDGRYTVGVAPKAELYSMRFADCKWEGATSERMLLGLEWAIDNGMDVVNMSFGYLEPVPYPSEEAAFNAAYEAGIVLVGASGNSGTPFVGYPAAYESVIAVGATDDADELASFSQYGSAQDVTAPGVNNLASFPMGYGREASLAVGTDADRELDAVPLAHSGTTDRRGITSAAIYVGQGSPLDFQGVDCVGKIALVSRGGTTFAMKATEAKNAGCAGLIIHNNVAGNFNGTFCADPQIDESCYNAGWIPAVSISLEEGQYLQQQIATRATSVTLAHVPGNLAVLSGTSMASPHAAGVAAVVLSKNPRLTPAQVRAVLQQSAEDLGAPGWDDMYGHGRVNARRALQWTP